MDAGGRKATAELTGVESGTPIVLRLHAGAHSQVLAHDVPLTQLDDRYSAGDDGTDDSGAPVSGREHQSSWR